VFAELMPLLAGRTVLITVATVDDKTIRVNVIPALAKADDNPALPPAHLYRPTRGTLGSFDCLTHTLSGGLINYGPGAILFLWCPLRLPDSEPYAGQHEQELGGL